MSVATDVARGEAILHAIARRLQTVAIGDPCLRSITFVVHFKAHGGWPQGVQMQVLVQDDMPAAESVNGAGDVDACGPTRRKW